jgi:hypothetical protein
MFLSIFCGDAAGDAVGIGIFICVCGDAEGDACGICIPGMFICICGEAWGAGDCVGDDGGLAGIFIPGMFRMSCFLAGCFFRATFFLLRVVAFDFGFGFRLLIPGMLCMSCWATTVLLDVNIRQLVITALSVEISKAVRILDFCIIPL